MCPQMFDAQQFFAIKCVYKRNIAIYVPRNELFPQSMLQERMLRFKVAFCTDTGAATAVSVFQNILVFISFANITLFLVEKSTFLVTREELPVGKKWS